MLIRPLNIRRLSVLALSYFLLFGTVTLNLILIQICFAVNNTIATFNNTLEITDFVLELEFNMIMKVIFVDEKSYKDIMRKQRTMKAMN